MSNTKAILLIILAMAAFTVEDSLIKHLSTTLPTSQVLSVIGILCAAIILVAGKIKGVAMFRAGYWKPRYLGRAVLEGTASACFVSAVKLVDLSLVAAVFQTTPLVVTLGAALFLGEQVGWRRWLAIFVGFTGVLIIIRPGATGFDPASLLVLGSVAAVAARDLMTRRIGDSVPSTVMSLQAYLAVLPASFALYLFEGEIPRVPDSGEGISVALAASFGVIGYLALVAATKSGDASVVTPFRYTRLLFSLVAAVLVFGENPDTLTLSGASLIIASGVYTFVRERKLARAAKMTAPVIV